MAGILPFGAVFIELFFILTVFKIFLFHCYTFTKSTEFCRRDFRIKHFHGPNLRVYFEL